LANANLEQDSQSQVSLFVWPKTAKNMDAKYSNYIQILIRIYYASCTTFICLYS